MLTKLIALLPTRDSAIWKWGLTLGSICTAITTLGLHGCDQHSAWAVCAADPTKFAYYGIPDGAVPYIRLIALITTILSGVMGTSPAAHSVYGKAAITPEDAKKGPDA